MIVRDKTENATPAAPLEQRTCRALIALAVNAAFFAGILPDELRVPGLDDDEVIREALRGVEFRGER